MARDLLDRQMDQTMQLDGHQEWKKLLRRPRIQRFWTTKVARLRSTSVVREGGEISRVARSMGWSE